MGHVPRYISTLCLIFIRHGGAVYSIVLGGRQYSRDLPQGGMEIPFRLHFVGNGGELKKVKSFLKAIPSIPGGQRVSVDNNQPVTNSDQPAMNSDQPVMNSDQPAMNSDQPAMNSDQPAMNSDQPAMNSDQPVMNSDQPVMNSDQLGESNMNYDYTVIDCDELSASKQESPQHITDSVMVSKQPTLDTNKKQPQTSLNDSALKSSKSTIQSNQLSNPPPIQSTT